MFAYAVAGPESPGYAVVTDSFVVLLSADAPPATVRAVHRLLDSPSASASAAITRLSEDDGAERFAVVEIMDPWTQSFRVSVRGDIRVDMGGASTTRFTWPQEDQLLTGEAAGVEALQLALGGSRDDAPLLPLRHGAVAASAIALDRRTVEAPAVEAPDVDHGRQEETLVARRGAPAEAEVTGAPTDSEQPASATPGTAHEPAAAEARRSRKDVRHESLAHEADSDGSDHSASAVDASPRSVDLASLMASAPSRLWTLTLPDGNELYAAPQIVVGRRPWRSSPDETQTYYVKAPSPHREISSKHVEFTVAGGQLRARDLDSTNGTVVESPDRPPRLLRDGNATRLDVGDVLDLGEGFRVVVGERAGN